MGAFSTDGHRYEARSRPIAVCKRAPLTTIVIFLLLVTLPGCQRTPPETPSPPVTPPPAATNAVDTAAPVADSNAELALSEGEIRLDGTVRDIDPPAGRLVLDVTSFTLPTGRTGQLARAKGKKVSIDSQTVIHNRGDPRHVVPFESLQPNDKASVAGRDQGPGSELVARELVVGGGLAPRLAATTPENSESDVGFARRVYTAMADGDAGADELIEWETFSTVRDNVGETYRKLPSAQSKADYRKRFIAAFSNSFKQSGAKVEGYGNWRVQTSDPVRAVVASDAPNGSTLLLTIVRQGSSRKLNRLERVTGH